MSISFLKIIACFLMLIDHIACVFGSEGWSYLPIGSDTWIRGFGRLAFPIFAFSVVNGWKHTSNPQKYTRNLMLFACISQIPYSLALYIVNRINTPVREFLFQIDGSIIPVFTIGILLWISFLIKYKEMKKYQQSTSNVIHRTSVHNSTFLLPFDNTFHFFLSFSLLLLFLLISRTMLIINGIWVLAPYLNVMYTFVLGICGIHLLNECTNILHTKSIHLSNVCLIISLSLFILVVSNSVDYGIWGVILIFALYLLDKKYYQMGVGILWSLLFYGVYLHNWTNAFFAIFGFLLLLLYNGEKGKVNKWFFYVFYPAHLFLIGLLNIIIKSRI